jgi:AcrR family transcriptional regulator
VTTPTPRVPVPAGAHALTTTFAEGDERRRPVLEAAARLLAEEGPHGLSLRRIAAEAGGSTQLVYTLFGGKSGLADALYAEGFGRLAAACRAALVECPPPGDPERLMAIGRAYRAFAKREPAFFAVMFGKAIPDFTPTSATSGRCRANTFGNLVAEVQACLDAGTLVAGDSLAGTASGAEGLARLCWVTVHGLSALESAGMLRLDDPDAFVDEALRTPLLAHRP